MTDKVVRTRFAPSPTGFLHVGGIRTALFCWLLARQSDGQFVLRLEDTDKKREVAGADKHLEESLRALGLDYDEGPDIGGPFAPYRQSERLETYKNWAKKLVAAGRAYADPYTHHELQAFRDEAQKARKPFLFRNHRPVEPPVWNGSQPLRFKSDPKTYKWHDEVMGELETGPEVIDDFILIKSDGYPTYNFSHIIDDLEMEISHIIRGQEFLASVPNYLNLYEALEIEPPVMATVPHILGPDGHKKLSKRDGAKDVLDYIRDGYLPDALVNFIASLGWNDGTEQEIYSRQELIEKFRLDDVQRSGARFDERRLVWMNGHYIRAMSLESLAESAQHYWPPEAAGYEDSYKKQVLGLLQERLKFLAEIPELAGFFFKEPSPEAVHELYVNPVDKKVKQLAPADIEAMLKATIDDLQDSDFAKDDLQNRLNGLLDKLQSEPGKLFAVIRIAVSGQKAAPELSGMLCTLGKDVTLKRINSAISALAT